MSFGLCTGLLALAGIAFSAVALVWEELRKKQVFRYGGIAAYFALLFYATGKLALHHQGVGGFRPDVAFRVVIPLLVASSVWAPFVACLFTDSLTGLVRGALGLDAMRVAPPCSKAEAAVARREFAEAERLYRELTAEYPDEAKPWRGLAELMLLTNRPTEAMACFQQAEERARDVGAKMGDCFAAADIMAERLRDLPAAIRMIERFAAGRPGDRAAGYCEERVATMRKRLRALPQR